MSASKETSGTAKILAHLEEITKIVKKIDTLSADVLSLKDQLAKQDVMLTGLDTKVSNLSLSASRPRPGGGGGSKATGNSGAPGGVKKSFPGNALEWLRTEYETDPEAVKSKFFVESEVNSVMSFLDEDPDSKDKKGEARSKAEFARLWREYVVKNQQRTDEIRAAFKAAEAAFKANSATLAKKEESS